MATAELVSMPRGAVALLVFAHGAGAGMRHEFMEDVAARLAGSGIGTLRYEFPYMAAKSRRIDPEPKLLATVEAALVRGRELAGDLPLFAGGKSMGGRMTSRLLAKKPELAPGVAGLVFFGFPLHPANEPARTRGDHLFDVDRPMLFLQGNRDALSDNDLIRDVTSELGGRATLAKIEAADHGFAVLKRSGRTGDEVRDELVRLTRAFVDQHAGAR